MEQLIGLILGQNSLLIVELTNLKKSFKNPKIWGFSYFTLYLMFKYIYILLFTLSLFSCKKEILSNPSDYLTNEENLVFKETIVRYFEGLPKNISHEKKWDTINNSYYLKKANEAELIHYYKNEDGFIFFTITKIAPSLNLKKVATIGKLKIEKDSVVYYEEICRTWKMELPELNLKSKILFDKIVSGDNIEEYYTKNSTPEFWIEFPDDLTYYDTKKRVWKNK